MAHLMRTPLGYFGNNASGLMREYQAAQDRMSKAGAEYVRGIPVVKVSQQTVNSFKAFKEAIDDYSEKAGYYQGKVCRVPLAVNLTFTEGAFVLLVPVALILAPDAFASGDFAGFVTDFAFYAVFSAIISTALAKIMFAASGTMLANTALGRIQHVMDASTLEVAAAPVEPQGNRVEFKNVTFIYEGATEPALKKMSFTVKPGQTVALVGPSGGGKTMAASLIPRFWDVTSGSVEVDGVDVRAVLKDAPIVVLDEATAFADPENEALIRKVQGALSRLLQGKTVLVIAHRMHTVEAADKIVVLADGRVIEEGVPADLPAKEDSVFARMRQLQSASAR